MTSAASVPLARYGVMASDVSSTAARPSRSGVDRREARRRGPATDDDDAAPAAEGAEAGEKILREQQARIAALRAAVLSGRVPDDEAALDCARFFDAPKDEPTGA